MHWRSDKIAKLSRYENKYQRHFSKFHLIAIGQNILELVIKTDQQILKFI